MSLKSECSLSTVYAFCLLFLTTSPTSTITSRITMPAIGSVRLLVVVGCVVAVG